MRSKDASQSMEQQMQQQQQQQQQQSTARERWQAALRVALLSVHFQSALQIAAGMFVSCLFTFVR
jgi:hypothetical protein